MNTTEKIVENLEPFLKNKDDFDRFKADLAKAMSLIRSKNTDSHFLLLSFKFLEKDLLMPRLEK